MIDGIIYKAVNGVTGKVYVGQTVGTLERRRTVHLAWANRPNGNGLTYFYNALRKHGAENFSWEIIDRARTKKELDRKEKSWIVKLGSKVPNGFNLTDGGEGNLGWVPSVETLKKMSASIKKTLADPKVKERMVAGTKKAMADPKYRAKISGKNHYLYGKHLSEKIRKKISKRNKGKNNFMYGKYHTEKTKKKMRENAGMRRPEVAAKISGENSPMKRPEVAAKFKGEKNPMYGQGKKIRGEKNGMFGRIGRENPFWRGGESVNRGYLISKPDHPRANSLGYVATHRLNWERHRGPIPPGKQVRFKDKSLKKVDQFGRRYRDPRIGNLYLWPDEKGEDHGSL